MSHFQNILPKQDTSPTAQASQAGPSSLLRTSTTGSTGSSEHESITAAHKRVSTACSACKTRKSKCDGKQPCERCVRHKTECIIDEDEDLRRRRAVKRKLEELESDRRLLVDLVAALRDSTNGSLEPLLSLIRHNGTMDDIRVYFQTEHAQAPQTSDQSVLGRTAADENDRPGSASIESTSRRRALDIGNLLNATEDTPMSYDHPEG